jgi:hypothetical protein
VSAAGQERQIDYFAPTNQLQTGYYSDTLQELAAYYSNRLRYEDKEEFIRRLAGSQQISEQKIQQLVINTALEVSQALPAETQLILGNTTKQLPTINGKVDLDEATATESLLLDAALPVKRQKEPRERRKGDEKQLVAVVSHDREAATERARMRTDGLVLEKKQGGFEYITGVIDNEEKEPLPLAAIVKSKVIQEDGDDPNPLNIVALTAGAKARRGRLLAIVGMPVVIILDWFHLGKKVRELMSRIAPTKVEKATYLKFIFYHLWHMARSDRGGFGLSKDSS